jgi:hypothetical protein
VRRRVFIVISLRGRVAAAAAGLPTLGIGIGIGSRSVVGLVVAIVLVGRSRSIPGYAILAYVTYLHATVIPCL